MSCFRRAHSVLMLQQHFSMQKLEKVVCSLLLFYREKKSNHFSSFPYPRNQSIPPPQKNPYCCVFLPPLSLPRIFIMNGTRGNYCSLCVRARKYLLWIQYCIFPCEKKYDLTPASKLLSLALEKTGVSKKARIINKGREKLCSLSRNHGMTLRNREYSASAWGVFCRVV